MNTHINKPKEKSSKSVANKNAQKQSTPNLINNRPETIAHQQLQDLANNSTRTTQAAQWQAMADNHATQQQQVPAQENNTGLPDHLKAGLENLSGYSLDKVKVHYNSSKPSKLFAHAYAQGNDIHLASGQEKHLAHEAWHIVQQKQGRVQPTLRTKGNVNINNDARLEREADVMGAKALSTTTISRSNQPLISSPSSSSNHAPIQGKFIFSMPGKWHEYDAYTINIGDGLADGDSDTDIISYLEFILNGKFDPEDGRDLTAGEKREIKEAITRLKGGRVSIRSLVGLGNPSHKSMKPMFQANAMSVRDPNRDENDWLFSPSRRFRTRSPTRRLLDDEPTYGHSNNCAA